MEKVKIIKKGVIIKFNANSNIIEKLYGIIAYMAKSLDEDQIEQYKKELESWPLIIKNEKQFSEEWMFHMTSLSILIEQLQNAAEEQGLFDEVDSKEVLGQIEQTLKTFIEDNTQPDLLSQSQPE